MNCPKCKNPIADDSQECEWCGFKIITKPKEKIKDVEDDVEEEEGDDENENEDDEENKTSYWGYLTLPALCLVVYLIQAILQHLGFRC